METNKYEKYRVRCAQCGFTFTKKKALILECLKPVIDEDGNVFCDMDCYLKFAKFVAGNVRELDDYDWKIHDINKENKHGSDTLQDAEANTH